MGELGELFTRYALSVARGWVTLLAAAAALGLFVVALRRRIDEPLATRLTRACVAVVALLAVLHAWHLRWLGDDAFISFRYAENWVRGHGLVFNPGERVEGYTNFLFTTLIALGLLVGAEPTWFSMLVTLSALAGAIGVTAVLAHRLLPPDAKLPGVLAAAALGANYTFASFGTSGLETLPAAFLVLLAVERAQAERPLAAGIFGILAALSHPDHLLLYAGLGAALVVGASGRVRNALLYGAPLVVVFVPYYLLRFWYYGDFFPNTYYAKSGGDAYFSQGFRYLAISGVCAGLVGVLPLALAGAYRRRRDVFGRFVLLAVPLYLLYVAKIGGDFMLGRLLCAVLPPLFLAAELGVRELLVTSPRTLAPLGLAAFALVALPNRVIPPQEDFGRVCDERTWYPLRSLRPLVIDEEFSHRTDALLAAFRKAPRPPKVGFCCVGILGYRTGYPLLDEFGLVTRDVAHLPILQRGRPGHEKVAGPGFAFEHGVDFSASELWPKDYRSAARLSVGGFDYFLAKYDKRLLAALARSETTRAPELEARIAEYSPEGRTPERVDCDLWFFSQLYFAHNANEPLRRVLAEKAAHARPAWRGLEELLIDVPEREPPGFEGKSLFRFHDKREFTARGSSFEQGPVSREAPGQSRIFGQHGRFASSYPPKRGDEATGTLVSSKFVVQGDAISLRVGGGHQPGRVEARLVVSGRTVASATGCDSELLGLRVFSTEAVKGKEARLELVDQSRSGWGHLLVDEVVEWQRVR